jgi:1,4-dihydroxy-2-naphthoyl-CoA hydrolase
MIARCSAGSWSKVGICSKGNLPPVTNRRFRPLPPEDTLDGALGLEAVEFSEDRARGRFRVEDHLRQPFGIVHGGVYAAIAESLASRATFETVFPEGMLAMGMSNHTSFLRPVFGGTVHSEARRRHRGRTTWIWDVDHLDDQGRLCAVSRVTTAVRPAPPDARRD